MNQRDRNAVTLLRYARVTFSEDFPRLKGGALQSEGVLPAGPPERTYGGIEPNVPRMPLEERPSSPPPRPSTPTLLEFAQDLCPVWKENWKEYLESIEFLLYRCMKTDLLALEGNRWTSVLSRVRKLRFPAVSKAEGPHSERKLPVRSSKRCCLHTDPRCC